MKRLTALAHELAADGLLADAGKRAHAELHKALDAARMRYAYELISARKRVLTVRGTSLTADLQGSQKTFDDFVEDADYPVIEDHYRAASRALSADLTRTYAEYLARQATGGELDEDALIQAHADIAALGLVPDVKTYLEAEADKLATRWLADYRVAIKSLSDDRQDVYRQIQSMSTAPQDLDLAKPKSSLEPTTIRQADGSETPLPTYKQHLLCDANGDFPVGLNDWEQAVLKTEMQRSGFVAWYRNPSRPSQDSLGIAYEEGGQTKILRPDFLFFSRQHDGSIAADIVDPHGTQFSDALPKLQGLARYAENHAGVYRRIEAIAKIGEQLRVLDLTDAAVRQAVAKAEDAVTVYQGALGSDF